MISVKVLGDLEHSQVSEASIFSYVSNSKRPWSGAPGGLAMNPFSSTQRGANIEFISKILSHYLPCRGNNFLESN